MSDFENKLAFFPLKFLQTYIDLTDVTLESSLINARLVMTSGLLI